MNLQIFSNRFGLTTVTIKRVSTIILRPIRSPKIIVVLSSRTFDFYLTMPVCTIWRYHSQTRRKVSYLQKKKNLKSLWAGLLKGSSFNIIYSGSSLWLKLGRNLLTVLSWLSSRKIYSETSDRSWLITECSDYGRSCQNTVSPHRLASRS